MGPDYPPHYFDFRERQPPLSKSLRKSPELVRCPYLRAAVITAETARRWNPIRRHKRPTLGINRRVLQGTILYIVGTPLDFLNKSHTSDKLAKILLRKYYPTGWVSPCIRGLPPEDRTHSSGVVFQAPTTGGEWEAVDVNCKRATITPIPQTKSVGWKLIPYCDTCKCAVQINFVQRTVQIRPWNQASGQATLRSWYPLTQLE